MMPIGPLMKEHRVIERMIKLMKEESRRIEEKKEADVGFIDKAIDFIRSYADRCHHGKEEGILFRNLLKKSLSAEHKQTIDELIKEHVYGRKMTQSLAEARESYTKGNKEALNDIKTFMQTLAEFYPRHIEKEDKRFFLPVMNYFNKEEQSFMLDEFLEFDQNLVHEKYKSLIKDMQSKK
ncbi:MAG: hemerythrin domain-containing protein [Candidatus Omnitrophota bacterium]